MAHARVLDDHFTYHLNLHDDVIGFCIVIEVLTSQKHLVVGVQNVGQRYEKINCYFRGHTVFQYWC